jgi:hypothetical protein
MCVSSRYLSHAFRPQRDCDCCLQAKRGCFSSFPTGLVSELALTTESNACYSQLTVAVDL